MGTRFIATLTLLATMAPFARGQETGVSRQESPPAASLALPAAFPTPSPAASRRIASLIERLRESPPLAERNEIIDQLVDTGSSVLSLLVAELERRDRNSWPVMVYVLGAIGEQSVLPVLAEHLKRQSGQPYLDVVYAMALAGDDTALSRALKSSHATMSFGQGGNVVDYIAGAMGPRAAPILMREIPRRTVDARVAALGALGTACDDSAVEFLIGWAGNEDALCRRYSLIALARIGDPRALDTMIRALADPDRSVREAAAEGLGYLHQPEAVPALLARLAELPRGPERSMVIWSLGLLGGPDAAKELAVRYERASDHEADWILQALGHTNDPAALDTLTQAALMGGSTTAEHGVRGLIAIDADEARERLLRICIESRSHAASLLAAAELVSRYDPRATPCITEVLRKDLERRQGLSQGAVEILELLPHAALPGAAEAIEALAAETTAPALTYRLRTASRGIRLVHELGTELDPWLDLLGNGTAEEVELAIRRLGELGDPRAVEPLRRLFGRIEPERSHLIPEALGLIGSERATPFLISLLTSDTYRVDELSRSREEAARALARYARSAHVADALEAAFYADRGRLFLPLMAYAKVRGREGISQLLEMKSLLMRRRDRRSQARHERANWAIRMLRAGREIPLSAISEQ